MKWLFYTLLVLNVGFFSFMQWGVRNTGEPLEAHTPINDAKIKVLPALPFKPSSNPGP